MATSSLTSANMNIIRFDRHQLFNEDWMDYHSKTLRAVEDFYLDKDESWYTPLYNQLCGIWDGYLYTELLEAAKEAGLPADVIKRIEVTRNYILIQN
jgi:hypothetical protein